MKRRVQAFTFTELLVVLIIIGILMLIATPKLMPLITKAKTVEAKQHLTHIHTLEKSYFYMYSKYSSDFNEIDYIPETTVDDEGTANYRIEITRADHQSFIATAEAVVDFNQNGVFNKWQIDQDKKLVEIVKD